MRPEAFPGSLRLKTRREFAETYDNSRRYREGQFTAYCRPNGLAHSRLGISIGSRFVKNATARNCIKRLIREAFRRNRNSIRTASDIVIVVKKDISGEKLEIFSNFFNKTLS